MICNQICSKICRECAIKMQNHMSNMQNMLINMKNYMHKIWHKICKKYIENVKQICKTCHVNKIMQYVSKYAKYENICKICKSKTYMQNMHSPLSKLLMPALAGTAEIGTWMAQAPQGTRERRVLLLIPAQRLGSRASGILYTWTG